MIKNHFHYLSLIGFLFSALASGASTDKVAAPRTQKTIRRLSSVVEKKPENNWSFILPSFVVHGFQPDPEVAKAMPNRMVGNGDSVATPGVGFQYVNADGAMILAAYVKDCFNNSAATIQFGEMYKVDSDMTWGWSFGFYARETPYVCSVGINGKKDCFPIADFPLKMNMKMGTTPVEVMPMPFLHYTYRMFSSEDFKVDLKLMANFFINEVGVEIPF